MDLFYTWQLELPDGVESVCYVPESRLSCKSRRKREQEPQFRP